MHELPQFRPIRLISARLECVPDAAGNLLVRSSEKLDPYPMRVFDRLLHWARVDPDRTFMARREERGAGDWKRISYGDACDAARRIGQYLIDRKLSVERPLLILSDNDLEHALMTLGAQYAGVAHASISPAYSLVSNDFDKLKHVVDILSPGMLFASDGAAFGRALAAVGNTDTDVVVTDNVPNNLLPARSIASFYDVLATEATDAIDAAYEAVGPDTVVKFIFTSGSTKLPKAVPNTQRMWCSNLQQIVQSLPCLTDQPLVLVDWLPWNHTFGGNKNFGLTIYLGGTFYIDDGKPTPKLMELTLRNLREIAPTVYFNVPKGFEELAAALHRDKELSKVFFSRLQFLFFAGASLSQPVWNSVEEAAIDACGERMSMLTGLGMTETSPSALFVNQPDARAGMIGIPVPGMELKLIPNGDKTEVRYRGPNLMAGYWRDEGATRESFDQDGFFISGDAIKFIDADNHDLGFMFDGRIAEDFKLDTGTWVSVGPLRGRIIAAGAPYIQDVVITGHDRGEVGMLIFPHLESCVRLAAQVGESMDNHRTLEHAEVKALFQRVVDDAFKAGTGSANRIARAMVLTEPPSLAKGEITDKGSINQRAVLKHRAHLVEELYAKEISKRSLLPKGAKAR